MNSTLRRLIAVVLMLWLPLQATAGLGAHTRASHRAVQAQMATEAAQPHMHATEHEQGHAHAHAHAHAQHHHAHHPVADAQALQLAERAASTASNLFDGGQCGDCVMCATALLQSWPAAGCGAGPHGALRCDADESFTSAACDPAIEPPISAA